MLKFFFLNMILTVGRTNVTEYTDPYAAHTDKTLDFTKTKQGCACSWIEDNLSCPVKL